ncbi:Mitogen-activated protein kinase kinase kinase [Actinidia chinensis var. chinensis]|uniref:mitogen-activated protein kinase kinase kinase n=1 Tax=Actinidia chinensis var. chinensis TaxID=1590841 RepID=A0A2R6R5Q2_ACTCC|nr:Mitogen-activated protein kinase kinase kinase [Actinidia chinensis var. chinensis]
MHWWQTPFSSASSSPSSSSKHHSDDSVLTKIFSIRSRAARLQQRRLNRSTKLRYDAAAAAPDSQRLWRSPSSQDQSSSRPSPVIPQPLPLPELAVLLRRDAAAGSCSTSTSLVNNIPLPSPKEPPSRSGEERERDDGLILDANGGGATPGSGFGGKVACHDSRKTKEHANTRPFRKSPKKLNGVERFQDSYVISVPISAPTSTFSSPAMSPQRSAGDIFTSHYMSPQVWSAPEMPPLDMNLGLGFSYLMFPEKTAFSVDSSPLHSPSVSPCRSTRSPTGPTSPLHKKLSLETTSAWCDSNGQANVHPLPLPRGATSPSQLTSISQITAKPDLMPIISQWQKGKLIGRGTFGSVYVASNRETGALCAMKEVELCFEDPKSAESIKQLEQEIKVLSQLKHPNIVHYYGSEIIDDRFYIYLEYVHPGSINKYIRDHCGAMTESVVRNFTRHILSGLAYLHSTKTIHRDIKGANLLVDAFGVVKLADFGMAKHLSGPAANLSLKGSPYWMAPELLQSVMQKDASSDLALAVDIWSLGCTIIEMLNGKPPWSEYEGAAAMFKVLRESPPIPETLSSEGKDFLHCCFRRNPADRPTASMLLKHRFLKNSPQLDMPACTQALNGMKLMEKVDSSREPPIYKLEHLLLSPDALRGKLANNFIIHDSFSPVRPANDVTIKLPS